MLLIKGGHIEEKSSVGTERRRIDKHGFEDCHIKQKRHTSDEGGGRSVVVPFGRVKTLLRI